jgi:hypothetical protein
MGSRAPTIWIMVTTQLTSEFLGLMIIHQILYHLDTLAHRPINNHIWLGSQGYLTHRCCGSQLPTNFLVDSTHATQTWYLSVFCLWGLAWVGNGYDPDGGCSGSHKDTHRNTHTGAHRNNIKLDSNHRQPILRFLSLAGSGYGMDQAWLWLWSGKARLDLVGFGIRLDQV